MCMYMDVRGLTQIKWNGMVKQQQTKLLEVERGT